MSVAPAILFLSGYLIGAIPFGLLAGWARGIDIRAAGSGNIGATNVGRLLGRPWGFAVFVLDFVKGFAPATWGPALLMAAWPAAGTPDVGWRLAAAMGAVIGHVAPVYLKFKGGKGVATGAGACAALAPVGTGIALAVWAVLLGSTRYMAIASMGAAIALPIAHALRPGGFAPEEWPVEGVLVLLSLVVLVRHRSNVARLFAGTETKIGAPKRSE